ncbi:hypothetical protein Vadar_016342 [Vaccinium darrowii]|uniref:Uncharacterized protein n=1 Tax=Vaccinium darrowii TaxID=229202 RepID=A0ACB7YDV5_9ERIC|nr:hypothetical protein Vadar_016342 [Vaccinium darrowii]
MLLNLEAFEACSDNTNDLGVTSYIWFMESIVDQDEDVKELQSKGIPINSIGWDKYVVDLFKDIITGLAPRVDAYLLVKTSIAMHLVKAKWTPIQIATWVKDVMRFAVLYAVVDILLSFIQTYFTVFPSPNKH